MAVLAHPEGSTVAVIEQPRGHQVRAFRESILIDGRPCTRKQFGEPLFTDWTRVKCYEIEQRGVLAPIEWWVLAQITWDDRKHEQWAKRRPKIGRRR